MQMNFFLRFLDIFFGDAQMFLWPPGRRSPNSAYIPNFKWKDGKLRLFRFKSWKSLQTFRIAFYSIEGHFDVILDLDPPFSL